LTVHDGWMVRSDCKSKFDRYAAPLPKRAESTLAPQVLHTYFCAASLRDSEMRFGGRSSITSHEASVMGKIMLPIELIGC
jgi:hypothetical protein